MKDAFRMWVHPKMVVLTAVCAAVYVAAMLPFKWAVIVPGLAEVRPATVFPVVFSFLFGPAGAWGAAFGNLVGDMLGGMFGLGSVFGFLANFAYGYIPYKLWEALFGKMTVMDEIADWESRMSGWRLRARAGGLALAWSLLVFASALLLGFLFGSLDPTAVVDPERLGIGPAALVYLAFVSSAALAMALIAIFAPWRLTLSVFVASMACAAIVAWGIELMGWVPFPVLGIWILVNNFSVSFVLAAPILALLYPRTDARVMLYKDILERPPTTGWTARPGAALVIASAAALFALGLFLAPSEAAAVFAQASPGLAEIPNLAKGVLLSPLVILVFIGQWLM